MTTTAAAPPFWSADWIGRFLDRATRSHAAAAATLIIVALLAFLPGFFQVPPVDRDEARFAQATKQMIETGEYVDIRFQDEVRYKKPIGIYWLQAAAVKAAEALGIPHARTRIAIYRIPSLLGAVGAVLLTYWAALAFTSRRYALLAGLMMATSILLGVEARLAKTDAMLLLAVVAAMGALARAYLGETRDPPPLSGWLTPAIFWTAVAAGILLKGPLIVMFVGLAAAVLVGLDRSMRWLGALRPVWGVLWCALLVLPWFLAIIERAGEAFFVDSFTRDMLAKVGSGQEGHGAPPGFYLVLFWVTFWPAAPLAALAAPAAWVDRQDKATRFLLAWLVPSWIVFELVATKLPHYVLPLYPAVAILIARAIERDALSPRPWLQRATLWWPGLAIVVPVLAVAALIVARHQVGFVAWPLVAVAVVLGVLAWQFYPAEGAERSLVRAAATALVTGFAVFGILIPRLARATPSFQLADALSHVACPGPHFAAAGYHEPSLVFLLGTDVRLTSGAGSADFLGRGPCRFALVESRAERSFALRADATGLRYSLAGRIDGFNISGGRKVSIVIFRSELNP